MLPRRWSLRAMLTTSVIVLLTFVAAILVAARPLPALAETGSVAALPERQLRAQAVGTGDVIINSLTCKAPRATDALYLEPESEFFIPDDGYDCVNGLPDGIALTVAGRAPDEVNEETGTSFWYDIPFGNHEIQAGGTSLTFDLEDPEAYFYAIYERGVPNGGYVEIYIYDCAAAPLGASTLVNVGEVGYSVPDGYEVCVDGNFDKRDYGLLVDGQPPQDASGNSAITLLSGGDHVATAKGGAQLAFQIGNDTVVLYLYTQGEVTGSLPPIVGLPNTGVGTGGGSGPWGRDVGASVALLVASIALGYVSFRLTRLERS